MLDTNAAYPQVLDGVGAYLESDSMNDVATTLSQFPSENLIHALNDNQITCKRWLIDQLYLALGGSFGSIFILGGWYGVLAALLLNDRRFTIRQVMSIDLDPDCEVIANSLNRSRRACDQFLAVTANASALPYPVHGDTTSQQIAGKLHTAVPNLVINTSCEHMSPSERWYDQIPADMLLALQTNDYYSCDEHVNCVESLEAFKDQVPMQRTLFAGTLERRRYSRFMLIGQK